MVILIVTSFLVVTQVGLLELLVWDLINRASVWGVMPNGFEEHLVPWGYIETYEQKKPFFFWYVGTRGGDDSNNDPRLIKHDPNRLNYILGTKQKKLCDDEWETPGKKKWKEINGIDRFGMSIYEGAEITHTKKMKIGRLVERKCNVTF